MDGGERGTGEGRDPAAGGFGVKLKKRNLFEGKCQPLKDAGC